MCNIFYITSNPSCHKNDDDDNNDNDNNHNSNDAFLSIVCACLYIYVCVCVVADGCVLYVGLCVYVKEQKMNGI